MYEKKAKFEYLLKSIFYSDIWALEFKLQHIIFIRVCWSMDSIGFLLHRILNIICLTQWTTNCALTAGFINVYATHTDHIVIKTLTKTNATISHVHERGWAHFKAVEHMKQTVHVESMQRIVTIENCRINYS